jgi:hypothetical protein
MQCRFAMPAGQEKSDKLRLHCERIRNFSLSGYEG